MYGMEISYSELREREVINVADGRSLGRVCDLVMSYPEGIVFGIVVPGRKGFRWFKPCCNDMFIDFEQIQKIGSDVILVDLRASDRPPKPPKYKDKDCHRLKNSYSSAPEGRSKIDMNDYE